MPKQNGKDDNNDGQIDMKEVTEALKSLPQGVQKAVTDALKETMAEQHAARAAAQANQVDDDDDDDDEEDDIDIERVSRAELVKHLNKQFSKALKDALKPIQDRLETTSNEAEVDRIKREFSEAASKHPDFYEWKDEMREIVQQHPELHAEDIYLLARSKHPEKAKQLDEKSAEDKGKDEEEDKKKRVSSFGGLLPTSGKAVETDGKKTPREAADSAWDEVMSQVPEEVIGQLSEG